MKKIVLMLWAVMVCGCEPAQDLVFEATECQEEVVPEADWGSGQCRYPSACCSIGERGLNAICEAYYPHQPTAVMCMNGAAPVGHVCAAIAVGEKFGCDWGESQLRCCDID